MIEHEYKRMLTKVEYDFLARPEIMECFASAKRRFQINYYYDTPQMDQTRAEKRIFR